MKELLEFAVMMAFVFLLAAVWPASFWLFAASGAATGFFLGWLMAEPLPKGRKTNPWAYPLGLLALIAAIGIVTYPWVHIGYLTWHRWLILPAVSVGYALAGLTASSFYRRRVSERLTK